MPAKRPYLTTRLMQSVMRSRKRGNAYRLRRDSLFKESYRQKAEKRDPKDSQLERKSER